MSSKKEVKFVKKVKKAKKSVVAVPQAAEEDSILTSMSLHGELFWEYRAKMAEYEKVLLERNVALNDLKIELSDPKNKKVVELLQRDEEVRTQLKEQANLLRGVQIKAAAKLGITIEVFLKDCLIDHETGVVRILE